MIDICDQTMSDNSYGSSCVLGANSNTIVTTHDYVGGPAMQNFNITIEMI